jgi:hypothetical protein
VGVATGAELWVVRSSAGFGQVEEHSDTMIVTNRPPRRKRSKAAEITASRIVQHTPKGRAWRVKELEPDPEADARVEAFFQRMGLKLPEDWARTKDAT